MEWIWTLAERLGYSSPFALLTTHTSDKDLNEIFSTLVLDHLDELEEEFVEIGARLE